MAVGCCHASLRRVTVRTSSRSGASCRSRLIGQVGKKVNHVEQIKIVGFAGSLRHASFNRGLIRAAAETAPSGITIEVIDLADIPLYNQDVEDAGEPASVAAFKRALAAADALLVATPEYNHGIPGVLKNAFDWASRPRATSPLRDKPIAIMGASPGRGSTARAQAQLREAAVFTGACVMPLPELLVGSAAAHFSNDGNLTDPVLRTSVVELVEALREWTLRLRLHAAA
jgi:chromate reductase